MFAWMAANKLIVTVGLIAVLSVAGAGLYFKGYSDGKNKQAAAQAQAEREAVVEGRIVEREIMRLPKNEVQKRLEVKWCRDCA